MENSELFIGYAAVIAGWTQVISDAVENFVRSRGVEKFKLGDWKQVIAVALGAIGTYLSLYHPELFSQLTILISGGGATGLVSFILKKLKK